MGTPTHRVSYTRTAVDEAVPWRGRYCACPYPARHQRAGLLEAADVDRVEAGVADQPLRYLPGGVIGRVRVARPTRWSIWSYRTVPLT
jgi:hypothetical protein